MSSPKNFLLPTPPSTERYWQLSLKERRKLNSSEESTRSLAPVNIDTTDTYRIGAPSPLPALPLTTSSASAKAQDEYRAHVEKPLMSLLQRRNVRNCNFGIYARHERGEEATIRDETVMLSMEKRDDWVGIANDIIEILQDKNLNFRLEIMDRRALRAFFAPRLSASQEARWPQLEARILHRLGMGPQWQTMGLLNRGHEEKVALPTVVVGVTRAADVHWQADMYEKIRFLVEDFSLEVAFIRSSAVAQHQSRPLTILSADDSKKLVTMGASIGVEDASGTLGGFVWVKYQGQTRVMGITCSHVIKPQNQPQAVEDFGYAPDLNRKFPVVHSPSNADTESSIKAFEDRITGHENKIRGSGGAPSLQEKIDAKGGPGFAIREQEILEESQNSIRQLKSNIASVKGKDRVLGSVFASSGTGRYFGQPWQQYIPEDGTTIETGNAIDWALLNIVPERAGGNPIPQNKTFSVENGFDGLRKHVRRCSNEALVEDQLLFKQGRMGTSCGLMTQFKHILIKGRFSRTAAIIGTNSPFMYPGDSGCWCLDSGGNWQALGFGGSEDSGTGYAIPYADVFEDIKARTGAEIVGVYIP